MDWDAIWTAIQPWDKPIFVAGVIIGAIVVRAILLFVIRRVGNRIVSGVKKREGEQDTAVLLTSPLAAVRVQRARGPWAACSATSWASPSRWSRSS